MSDTKYYVVATAVVVGVCRLFEVCAMWFSFCFDPVTAQRIVQRSDGQFEIQTKYNKLCWSDRGGIYTSLIQAEAQAQFVIDQQLEAKRERTISHKVVKAYE